MTETEERAVEARLSALEYLLADAISRRFSSSPDPVAACDLTAKRMGEQLEALSIPGAPPEQSMLVTSETSRAAERLLRLIREMTVHRSTGQAAGD